MPGLRPAFGAEQNRQDGRNVARPGARRYSEGVRCAWATALVLGTILAPEARASYQLKFTGPRQVYQGFDTVVQLWAEFGSAPANLYFTRVTVPPGLSYHLSCSPYMPDCFRDAKGWFQYGGTARVELWIKAGPEAAPGDDSIVVETEAAGEPQKLAIPLRVVVIPPAPTPPEKRAAPPIPKLRQWRDTMRDLASLWCNPKHPDQALAFGVESQVWYYDGARVYFQIADYTGDRKWENCAFNVARQYRDYVTTGDGKVPGYRVFPHGLRMAYERSKDESYRRAVMLLAKNSPYAQQGGMFGSEWVRENAYAAEAYINAEKLGAPRDPRLARVVDYLLAYFEMSFVSRVTPGHQTFMDGLAAEALIEAYGLTKDPRVLPTLEIMCDWMWREGWDHKRKQLVYNPEPKGPNCTDGCQSYATDLVNLVAPAFAWVWRQTGEDKYRAEGDDLCAHALDSDISYSGKIFSQNYRWSFDYVRWRSE